MNIKKLYTKIIIVLILLVIINMGLLFCLFITPMQIQGDSMEPNYKNGEVIFVDKATDKFGYLDVVVFNIEGKMAVKRIIGVPGDRIVIKEGILYRNNCMLLNSLDNINIKNIEINLNLDEYFLAGDNFIVSKDSRHYGPISRKDIIGRVI